MPEYNLGIANSGINSASHP